jgi:excisionase family DNA binding protein
MPRKLPPVSRLLSVPEAAAEYRIGQRTLRRYIAEGWVTGWRFGPRMIRVDRREMDALLRPSRTSGGDAA